MPSFYLWDGVDAIEVIECATVETSIEALQQKTSGDWTLWYSEGHRAVLLAVNLTGRGRYEPYIADLSK